VFPGLLKFFQRWLQADADRDGLPEWQHELQTGYGYWPTFGGVQPWADNTDMHTVESPDLLAYLLSEAISLQAIASTLQEAAHEQQLGTSIRTIQAALDSLWNGERYVYRDRDTHTTAPRQTVLKEGRGDQAHILAIRLDPPGRLNLRIQGGVNHTPRFKLEIKGLDLNGQEIQVSADQNAFIWQQNRGVHTTEAVFSQVDVVRFDGLSRVYSVDIHTPDTTRLDLNALLPLWAVLLPDAHQEAIIDLLRAQFVRPNGVTMCAASDPAFDPSNAAGCGGIWPFWLNLIGEGLIEAGRLDLAADLLQRLLRVQVEVLRQHKHFSEFYHSDQAVGLGTPGHLGGSVPVNLLLRVLGVRIISTGKVWTGGTYAWSGPVSVRQHGVEVQRSADGTTVTFPSGYEVQLPADAEWQAVIDPKPKPTPTIKAVRPRSITPTHTTES
ncbi:MAG: hypothetical protein K8J31_23630, partial [Anaerolineae bacterium]|nr:hypothetical protein [Anaerolineae bacterium]